MERSPGTAGSRLDATAPAGTEPGWCPSATGRATSPLRGAARLFGRLAGSGITRQSPGGQGGRFRGRRWVAGWRANGGTAGPLPGGGRCCGYVGTVPRGSGVPRRGQGFRVGNVPRGRADAGGANPPENGTDPWVPRAGRLRRGGADCPETHTGGRRRGQGSAQGRRGGGQCRVGRPSTCLPSDPAAISCRPAIIAGADVCDGEGPGHCSITGGAAGGRPPDRNRERIHDLRPRSLSGVGDTPHRATRTHAQRASEAGS